MKDYYEINVSLNGVHFFATTPRSITTLSAAEHVYNIFKNKFPESEGYKLDITSWESVGHKIEF